MVKYGGRYCGDSRRYFLFTNEEEAKKSLELMIKNYEKARKSKDIKKPKFGSEINHKDRKGNVLHIGDKVAYVHPTGNTWGAKQDISVGIVMSDSKTMVTIYDEDESKEIKELRRIKNIEYKEKGYKLIDDNPKDGYHIIDETKILLIEKFKK
jgi:hypothetical protein